MNKKHESFVFSEILKIKCRSTTTFNYNANFLSRIKETKTKGERDEGANFNQIEEVR